VFDFIVVGAGMAGASVAAALASTARVALIEAERQPGFHATGRSAALFVPSYGSAAFRALTRASAAFLRAPPEHFSPYPLLRPRGALYLARADQLERLQAMLHEMRVADGRLEMLSVEAALTKVPRLRPGYLAAALYESDVYDIDVAALLQGFLRLGKSRGLRLHVGHRCSAPEWQDAAWHLRVDGETLSAPVLVNAAGAWADELAIACGAAPLGLRAMRRTAALIDAPEGVTVDAWPAVFDVEAALDFEVRRVGHSWAGLRTFAPDRNPVIGFDTRLPALFWCAGQGGYGIQSAPACAQLAAALARGAAVPAAIAAEGVTAEAVSPARFTAQAAASAPG